MERQGVLILPSVGPLSAPGQPGGLWLAREMLGDFQGMRTPAAEPFLRMGDGSLSDPY